MTNFKMYLEIGSQGHKKKLSSKFKKNKKRSTVLCREPARWAFGKESFPRVRLEGPRQRVFAESRTGRPSAKVLCREPFSLLSAKGISIKKNNSSSKTSLPHTLSNRTHPISPISQTARARPCPTRRRPNPPPPAKSTAAGRHRPRPSP